MKKVLSIVSLIAMAMIANAQSFTLTHEGNAVTEGSEITLTTSSKASPAFEDALLDLVLVNTDTEDGHWTLMTETPAGNTFSVSAVCGNMCQPNVTQSNVDVPAGETKNGLSVHFAIPSTALSGTSEGFTVKLHNRTTDADVLTFHVTVTYSSNSIKEAAIANITRVYPNPAVSNVTVEYAVEGTAQFVMVDVAGREVMQQYVSGNGSMNLNVESLHKGVYLYGIRQGNKSFGMKKLVVK